MVERAIGTRSMMDMAMHLSERLNQTLDGAYELREETCGEYQFCYVSVTGSETDALEGLSQALSLLLLRDYFVCEMAGYIQKSGASLTDAEAHQVLIDTLRHAHAHESQERIARCVREQLSRESELVLEGLLRFRMPEVHASWLESAEYALQNSQIKRELAQFSRFMYALHHVEPELLVVHVVFQPGGAYVLLDEAYQRICEDAYRMVASAMEGEELLMGLLIAMSPAHIVLYNAGEAKGIAEEIGQIFGERVEFA